MLEGKELERKIMGLPSATVVLLFALLFSGCATLFPVEETKYLHFENGNTMRIDRQSGKAFDTRKVYEIRNSEQQVWGHWVCKQVPATDTEHCVVRQINQELK